jgi:alanine racemase
MSNTHSSAPDARAWVEVDLDALRANFRTVSHAAPRAAMIAMVKAEGYGVGAERTVRALAPLSPWGYGVATADEGAALRRIGVTDPVVVFSPLPPDAVETAASARLTASISDLGGLERWSAAAQRYGPLDFHVEIDDTGDDCQATSKARVTSGAFSY